MTINKIFNKNIMKKVVGLDSLRFILAFIVLLGHGGIPHIQDTIIDNPKLNYIINSILGNTFVGIAAVMAFFIISGFVIHYPYSLGRPINIKEFYLRRILRIAIPAFTALAIYQLTYNVYMGVAWSLICEVIYYLIYPLVLKFVKYLNFIILTMFIFSYILSVSYTLMFETYNGDFHRDGFLLTWIVGFPVWLLGVKIAENIKKPTQITPSLIKLNKLRVLVWFLAFISSILRFHFNIAYSYSLPLFSIVAFIWIEYEIRYFSDKQENKILEYGGLMSYSIYLVHAYVFFIVKHYLVSKGQTISDDWRLCLVTIFGSLFASWVFYILVEKPSHKLSRSIKLNRNI